MWDVMSQPGISVICHLKAYLIIWSVSIFWTTCHFFLSLGSNDSHRWQIDIKVCWVCIPVDYVTGRSEREWMQEWRTVPPPLELASSPSLTHTSHIPNISGLKYYLHNAVGSFFDISTKQIKKWWLHLGHIIERKGMQERERLNWSFGGTTTFPCIYSTLPRLGNFCCQDPS